MENKADTFNSGGTDQSPTLTTKSHWQETWTQSSPTRGFELFDDLVGHLPTTPGLSFFEIGCAPGGILAEFCVRMNYEANGLDYAVDSHSIESFLRSQGARVGQIFQEDFLKWDPPRQYDIVASFGFIEHFENAAAVVDRHFNFVRPGGLVIITMPHFAHGQKVLHWLYDRKNLRLHNTKIMNLRFLTAAAKRNKAQLLEGRYAGGHYTFWTGGDQLSWLNERLMWRTDSLFTRLSKKLPPGNNALFSPFLMAVYRTFSDR